MPLSYGSCGKGGCGREAAIGWQAAAFEGLQWTGQREPADHVPLPWTASPPGSRNPETGRDKGGAIRSASILGERLFSREGVSGWGSLELFSDPCDSGGCVSAACTLVHKKY